MPTAITTSTGDSESVAITLSTIQAFRDGLEAWRGRLPAVVLSPKDGCVAMLSFSIR